MVDSTDGLLSLREALTEVGSIITFDPALYSEGRVTIALDGSELAIEKDVSIKGPGADLLRIDAGKASRVFSIDQGVAASLSGLEITRGSANYGGGIYNKGALAIINSKLSANSATEGGGVLNSGILTVTNSILSSNSATEGTYTFGGAICNSSGTLIVTNSTLAWNEAARGGGIYSTGVVSLNNSIVARNTSSSRPDVYVYSGTSHRPPTTLIGDGTGQSTLIHGQDGNLVGTAEDPVNPLFLSNVATPASIPRQLTRAIAHSFRRILLTSTVTET